MLTIYNPDYYCPDSYRDQARFFEYVWDQVIKLRNLEINFLTLQMAYLDQIE